MSRFSEECRRSIQEHQTHALEDPFWLGGRPHELRVMVFPLSTRRIYALLTIDPEWVDGVALAALFTRDPDDP